MFRALIRFLFVISNFHQFFRESMVGFSKRLVYLSKFSKWLHSHPCREFNDTHPHNRYELYQFIYETENLEGKIDYLEFGVAKGDSLKWWIEKNKDPGSRFFGFDTFTGLPEKWDGVPKGTFTANGNPPQIQDNRLSFEIGLFQDTLFGFLVRYALAGMTVVHMDCDLYSSTFFVLTTLAAKMKKGDILIFDEIGSIRHPTHEFRAFDDFLSVYKFNYKVIGASKFYYHVAIKLI